MNIIVISTADFPCGSKPLAYFFIFHTKNQAFVVEKSTFSGGTPEELRDKLSVLLGKKYYINKY